MKVVSNSSPLINLAWIDQLHLLPEFYGEILIPEAVWDEIVIQGSGQPGAKEVGNSAWITARKVKNTDLVLALRQELDAGEAEAIALALEEEAAL